MLERWSTAQTGLTQSQWITLPAGLASRYLADDKKRRNFRRALVLDPLFWEARVAMADRYVLE